MKTIFMILNVMLTANWNTVYSKNIQFSLVLG